MRRRLSAWVDKQSGSEWLSYAFLGFLVLVGCCCGSLLTGLLLLLK